MAQLIAAADGTHVWSERYDRELADVFAVQDEIAAAITGALRLTLSPASALPRRHTPSLLAYDQYLKALHLSDATTPQTMVRAREHFERAIALDPQFALAHAEFAHLYHLLAIYGVMAPLEAMPLMREHTRRALEIDPSLPEGRAMLGTVAMFDFDWPEAERQFRLAMSHGAVAPRVRRYYAHYCLLPTGRAQEAVEQYRLGLSEDPLNLQFRTELAVCLRAAGRLAESRRGIAAHHADRRDLLVSVFRPRREPGAGWTPRGGGRHLGAGVPAGTLVHAHRRIPGGDVATHRAGGGGGADVCGSPAARR